MSFYLKPSDKDTLYIREGLYIPKSKVHIESIKQALTFEHSSGEKFTQYTELENHIIVPRRFIPIEKLNSKMEVIDLRPKKYETIKIESKVSWRGSMQLQSYEAINDKEGILVLGCGSGKTVIALQEAYRRKVPTLIVVNTGQLLQQWKDRIAEFLEVESVGIIKGDVCDYEHPITIAMIQTLSSRREDFNYKIRKYFGFTIWDECDEVATPHYSKASDIFIGDRLGMSATPKRKDGAEKVFEYHMGNILFTNQELMQYPKAFFVKSTYNPPIKDYILRWADKFNFAKLYTDASLDKERNNLIKDLINRRLKEGRKILVLGERKQQLKDLHDEYENSGLCIAEVDVDERMEMLRNCKVIFAISRLSKRGLDQADLDSMIILTPMSDEGRIRQAVGRITRKCETKKSPEIYIIEDINIGPMKALCIKMGKVMEALKLEVKHISL
jgi:superfamily II DNA or RNA helicase